MDLAQHFGVSRYAMHVVCAMWDNERVRLTYILLCVVLRQTSSAKGLVAGCLRFVMMDGSRVDCHANMV